MNETAKISAKADSQSLAEKVLYNLPFVAVGVFVVGVLAHGILA